MATAFQLQELLARRVVLITGKGGVGRSTLTAALAHCAQRAGKRVLVAEIFEDGDDYSALAQLFGEKQLPRSPAPVAPGILGTQLLTHTGFELFLTSVIRVAGLARIALGSEALRRLLTAAPSFREMGIFYHLLTLLRERGPGGAPAHDLILCDMPATGHTLALTGLPQILLRLVSRGPIADALREGQSYLNDPVKAAAYVVTLPETLPVTEALELIEGLRKTLVPIGGVLLNRTPEDPFSAEESSFLRSFLQDRAVYGGEGFFRMKESLRSVERLRSELEEALIVLPEADPDGPDLVEQLVVALGASA